MSASSETKFYPKGYPHKYRNDKGQFQCVHYVEFSDVMDWFKRCVEDFPEYNPNSPFLCDSDGMLSWFDKWFSQFRNKSEK